MEEKQTFFEKNEQRLADFSRLSQAAGARADYVQGGGGNTSVKLADGLMAIKASGYCLGDIRPDKAYAVMDYEALRKFYYGNEPADLEDVEKQGSACAKEGSLCRIPNRQFHVLHQNEDLRTLNQPAVSEPADISRHVSIVPLSSANTGNHHVI